jgi:predicted transcriptional regulator
MQQPEVYVATPDSDDTAVENNGTDHHPVLWHAEDGHFDPGRLHRAIVARGWTIPEFAQTARMHLGTLYRALTGKPTNDATAIRIFQTLDRRKPMDLDL